MRRGWSCRSPASFSQVDCTLDRDVTLLCAGCTNRPRFTAMFAVPGRVVLEEIQSASRQQVLWRARTLDPVG